MQHVPDRIWDRQTPWRQGSVIDRDTLVTIGALPEESPADRVGVVISHDCDLALDNIALEPLVEFIVGSAQPRRDGNYSWAKSTRTLQLDIKKAGEPALIELGANNKQVVGKELLAPYEPDRSYELEPRQLAALRDWLAARYNRTAFPDEFNKRLDASGAPEKLKKLLATSNDLISFVYFDLMGRERDELPAGVPYDLTIVLVHFPGQEPEEAGDKAAGLVEKIEAALTEKFAGGRSGIVYRGCAAISEEDIKLGQAQTLMRWRLDFITLKATAG
jgi:hypothetical protein